MIGLDKYNRIVNDNLDLSKVDLNVLKKQIFSEYDKLACKSGEEYIEEEPFDKVYIFHSLKFIKTGSIYEVLDTSIQKVVNSYFPEKSIDEESIIIQTEYSPVRNRFFLYLVLNYLKYCNEKI